MKKFHAVGTDEKGRKYAGTFEASSETEARRMLASEGYKILTLEELPSETDSFEEARKKVSLPPREKKEKSSAGKAYAGGAAKKNTGTGAVLAAAGLLLAALLAVMGYISAKKEDPLFRPSEKNISLPAPGKTASDFSTLEKARVLRTGEPEEEDGFEAAVEAEAAEVRVYDAAESPEN